MAARPALGDEVLPADLASKAYVGLMASYVDPADRRNADYNGGGTIFAGLRLNQQISAEVRAFGAILDREGDRNTPFVTGVGGDLRAMERHGFFLLGGAGVEYGSADKSHRASPYLEAGAGYEHHLYSRLSLRVEASYRMLTNLGNNGGDPDGGVVGELWAGVGLVFHPSYRHRAVVADTGPSVAVVDVRCPPAPAGFAVDGSGILAAQDSRTVAVNFETDSAKLDAEGQTVLNQLAQALRCSSAQQLAVQVIGHADLRGDKLYNVGLAERRAAAVRDALIEDGVEPERIDVVSEGKYEPLIKAQNASANSSNRRIEIKLYAGIVPE
jgi:outer membrane protein OmpA-like peptidoglycan-associated protein